MTLFDIFTDWMNALLLRAQAASGKIRKNIDHMRITSLQQHCVHYQPSANKKNLRKTVFNYLASILSVWWEAWWQKKKKKRKIHKTFSWNERYYETLQERIEDTMRHYKRELFNKILMTQCTLTSAHLCNKILITTQCTRTSAHRTCDIQLLSTTRKIMCLYRHF